MSIENVQAPTGEVGLLDIVEIVVKNLRLLIAVPVFIGVIGLGVGFLMAPIYTATGKFLPPQQQQSAAASMIQSLGGFAAAASGLKNPADQYVAFLRTRVVQDALVNRFNLKTEYNAALQQDARRELEQHTRITLGKDNIITVEVDGEKPVLAADIANGYMEELRVMLDRLAVTEAKQRRLFFERQLQQSKSSLVKAQQALGASGIGGAALNANPAAAVESMARLRALVTSAEVRIASMRSYLTDTAPVYQQAVAELNALRAQVNKVERAQPDASGGDDYIAKFREFKYQEVLFDLLARQYESARVDESREGALVQVLDRAIVPERKSGPRKSLIAIGSAVFTAIFLFLMLFAAHIWKRVSEDDRTSSQIARIQLALKKSAKLL